MRQTNRNNQLLLNHPVIVVHYAELALKGKNRSFFERQLVKNIQELIPDVYISKGAGRLILQFSQDNDIETLIASLKFIPGISNFFPGLVCLSQMKIIKQRALEIIRKYSPQSFKVEATRADKQFPLTSLEIARAVGSYILKQKQTRVLKVDVQNPGLEIKIEIEKSRAFVLGKKYQGIGGLPVGTSGKGICLLSGGLDSPVAGFMMMKRGVKMIFVHFHNQTIQQQGVEQKIKDLVAQLAKVQGPSKLYIVPFADLQKMVIANISADLRMIVYRRLMLKIAELIAKKENAKVLVLGDSVGQVASQTLENLFVTYQATSMLKLCPLIGLNKQEIINIAQLINTYDISIQPYEDCCSLMISAHPETKADIKIVEQQEKHLKKDVFLIKNALKASKKLLIV